MDKISVDNGQNFDFGKTSEEYAKYRDIYPQCLFDRMYELGIGHSKTRWLDLGTGTGVIPRGLASHGASITAVDISQNQINEAKKLSVGTDNITYAVCSAEELDYPENSFDAITACQCFWYFEPNVIVPKIKSMLCNGGLFLKIYMGYLENDPVAGMSDALVREMNPKWDSSSAAIRDLGIHYFDKPQTESFFADIPFTRESWHGRMKACRGTLASMDEDTFACFEERHVKNLLEFPEKFTVRHEIFLTYYRIDK